jgi:hypothetical protein
MCYVFNIYIEIHNCIPVYSLDTLGVFEVTIDSNFLNVKSY